MKTAVITGSTRGIGFAMAAELLRAGCRVTLSGRDETLSEAARTALSPFKDKYNYVPCNVQKRASLQNLWDASLKQWGGIDIWIKNAGQNAPHSFSWKTGETYTDNLIQTNITGMIFDPQIAAAEMIQQRHGAIYSIEGLGPNSMI